MSLKLIGEVALDGSGFISGLTQLEAAGRNAFGSLKHYIAGAFGGAGAFGIEEGVRRAMEAAEKIHRMRETYGLSNRTLQEWGYAASLTDTSLESLAKAYKKFAAAKLEAEREPGGRMAENLALVGIEVSRLNRESPEALMYEIAQGMVAASEDSDQFAAALKILGKNADEVLPALKALSGGIGKQAPLLSDRELSALATESAAWKSGLQEAKGLMGHAGAFLSDLERVARGTWLNLYGIGKAIVVGSLDKSTNIREQWQEFEMARQGRTLDEQFRAHPEQRGLEIPWQGAGGPKPEKGVRGTLSNEEMHEAAEDLRRANEIDERTRVQGETREQRITELIQKQLTLKEQIAKLPYGADYGEAKLELAKTQAELAELERRKEKEIPEHRRAVRIQGDSLIRVGNFLGTARNVMEDIAQRQVQLLQQIANNTRPQTSQAFGGGSGFSDDNFPTT